MNNYRMQFAIGVVTLMAGFALAAIIIWFGELQSVLQTRKQYYVTLPYAPGAEPKMPVRRAGLRVGEVTDVEYSEEWGLVVLTVVIEGDNELREGDQLALRRSSLFGDTFLDVETRPELRGVPDRPIVPPDTTLRGEPPVDTQQFFDQASEMIPNTNQTLTQLQAATRQWEQVGQRTNKLLERNEENVNLILEETRQSVERLRVTLESINNVLDPVSQDNLRVTLQNLRDTSEDLTPLIDASQTAIEQITKTTGKMDEVAQNLKIATGPLAERSESTMKNLDESAASLNALLADARILIHQLGTQDGTLQRLASDPTLYENLDAASAMLATNLAQLEKIMADLRVFSDKIARHPGELGLQGVLSRDRGLKEVPPDQAPAKHGLFRR